MVPHYNYYPPSGVVIDATDPKAQWNGKAWMLNGRVYGVPSSHRLIGKTGTSHAGWYYDWQKKAWMEPSPPPAQHRELSTPRPAPRPAPLPPKPGPAPAPVPTPQPPAPQPAKKETCHMEKQTVLDDLIKHPVAPVVGGLLLVASYVTDEPTPPTIPADLPEEVQKQWQMVFSQNQQRFERRMGMFRDLATVLLGYSGARSIVDVLGPQRGMLGEKKA